MEDTFSDTAPPIAWKIGIHLSASLEAAMVRRDAECSASDDGAAG